MVFVEITSCTKYVGLFDAVTSSPSVRDRNDFTSPTLVNQTRRHYEMFRGDRRRKKEELRKIEDKFEEKELDNVEEREKKQKPSRKNFKYYFNRFRYYYYYTAKKVDNFLAIVSMWVIKIMFYIMSFKVNGFPSIDKIMESG